MLTKPRVVFMGTPEFAVPSLKALVESGFSLVGVYTQPPRPKGRGHHVQMSPVHTCALEYGLSVFTPPSLKSPEVQQELAALHPDLLIVAAYGLILPPAILKIPLRGCLNVHGSLLPRWRGAAPIQRAILAGDTQTGITIMEMEAGLDTGPMLSWQAVPLSSKTTAVELSETLAALGAKLLVSTLEKQENIIPVPQPLDGVTYASKICREEGKLDWNLSAVYLHRQVRALNPWPGTWFLWEGKRIKVLEAEIKEDRLGDSYPPGAVLSNDLGIQCKEGIFCPVKVMPEGGKAMSIEAFLRGHPIETITNLYFSFIN